MAYWFLLSALFCPFLFCGSSVSKTQVAMWAANILLSLCLYCCGHVVTKTCCDPCFNHLTFSQKLCIRQIKVNCDACVFKNCFDDVSCKCKYEGEEI